MTPNQIALVRAGFRAVAVAVDADGFAAAFYARLFAEAPELAPLFAKSDMRAQRAKLAGALAFVVQSLDRPEAMLAEIRALGVRHRGYGVADAHYAAVGAALVGTLAERLGPAFGEEAREAWIAAYTMLSGAMIAAARESAAA